MTRPQQSTHRIGLLVGFLVLTILLVSTSFWLAEDVPSRPSPMRSTGETDMALGKNGSTLGPGAVDPLMVSSLGSRSAPEGEWQAPIAVVGRVTSSQGEQPVEGALVQLSGWGGSMVETRTAWDGSFGVEWIGPARANLLVAAEGFSGGNRGGLELAADPLELVLTPLGGVRVIFESPGGASVPAGSPVEFYRGALKHAVSQQPLLVSTGSGQICKADLAAGTWSLVLRSVGLRPVFLSGFEVRPGEVTDLLLAVAQPLGYGGMIVERRTPGQAGNPTPVGGATVTVWPVIGGLPPEVCRRASRSGVSSANGRFLVPGLGTGPHKVQVETALGEQLTLNCTIEGRDPTHDALIEVRPSGRLEGRVIGVGEDPVVGALIRIVPAARRAESGIGVLGPGNQVPDHPVQETRSDHQGRFVFEQVLSGARLCLVAYEGSFVSTDLFCSVPIGSAKKYVTLRMPPTGSLAVRVFGSGSRPLSGAKVSLLRTKKSQRKTQSGLSPTEHTDHRGLAQFDLVPRKFSQAQVSAAGWMSANVNLIQGEEVRVSLQRGTRVEGQVVDEQGWGVGSVLVRALVKPRRGRGSRYQSEFTTGSGGSFHMEGVPEGVVSFSIPSDVWRIERSSHLFVRGEQVLSRDLCARRVPQVPGGSLRLEVRELGGAQTPEGISLSGIAGLGPLVVGPYVRLGDIKPGDYRASVKALGFEDHSLGVVHIQANQVTDAGLVELRPFSTLIVRATGPGGVPLKRALVSLAPLPIERGGRGSGRTRLGNTDKNGQVEISRVPASRYRLHVTHSGNKEATQLVQVQGNSQVVTMRLLPKR